VDMPGRAGVDASPQAPSRIVTDLTPGDRIFRGTATGAGGLTLLLLAMIGFFLFQRSLPALQHEGLGFLTGSTFRLSGSNPHFGIAAVLYWTVVIAVIALAVAVPVSLCAALFLVEYAPPAVRGPLTGLVDLLAAVPSLVYGLWGVFFLQPHMVGTVGWLARHLSFLPPFAASRPNYTGSALIAGLVVSIMVVPITTSVMREVFAQTPPAEKEAALALGSTRWGMVRAVVLPFGRGGLVGGTMLGLGRALGETIAVALIISPIFTIRADILSVGANGVAPLIALNFGEAASGLPLSALMAAGCALFAMTLVVNFAASIVVARSRSGGGVEI
jgi:phosphate transport system permease protein